MRAGWIVLGLLIAALAGPGCGKRDAATDKAGTAQQDHDTARTAPAADMCAEHGVLEAICTKCHPNLIPVFQSKGDWCAEHGFPMSVCPVHHPEHGGRPAVAVAIDEAPATGTKVRFKSLQVAKDVGLETAAVVPGKEGIGILATATLVADASNVAVVNPRVAGVVRAIQADLGSRVAKGAPLALLESSAVGEERSRLLSAKARESVASANYARHRELHEKGMSATQEVQESQREWEAAKAEVAAAAATLQMIGASGEDANTYTLRAPIAGVVTKRTATVGTLVDTDDSLFEIVNTSQLWAEIDVPEAEAGSLRLGQRVVLTVDGLPGREFLGTVRFISPVVDPETRTVQARAAIPNQNGELRANMYARARIRAEGAGAGVLVPKSALQEAKGAQLVFVQLAPDLYEARRVRAVPAEGDMVAIGSGVSPTERVVTTGSFLLKTETLKESIGIGCCEVEPPRK